MDGFGKIWVVYDDVIDREVRFQAKIFVPIERSAKSNTRGVTDKDVYMEAVRVLNILKDRAPGQLVSPGIDGVCINGTMQAILSKDLVSVEEVRATGATVENMLE